MNAPTDRPKLIYIIIMPLATLCLAGLVYYHFSLQNDSAEVKAEPLFTYDPGPASALPIGDSLQYFYNQVECRGTAFSSGEFFVRLKHPVFRTRDSRIKKLEAWIQRQTYILALETEDGNETVIKKFGQDYPAYARAVLNSWLSEPESSRMGCMQESLAVEIVLNTQVLTLKVTHGGYWGGAHGSQSVRYAMFDRNFDPLEMSAVFRAEALPEFKKLLMAEYDRQVNSYYDYGPKHKGNPSSFGLTREGCVAQYEGYSHAEGNPAVFIPYSKFRRYLKVES